MDILSTYSTGGRPDFESERIPEIQIQIPPFYRASIMGYRSEIQLLFPTKEPKAYKYQHEWPHFRAAPSVNHMEFCAELSGWYPEHPGLKGPFTLSPKCTLPPCPPKAIAGNCPRPFPQEQPSRPWYCERNPSQHEPAPQLPKPTAIFYVNCSSFHCNVFKFAA